MNRRHGTLSHLYTDSTTGTLIPWSDRPILIVTPAGRILDDAGDDVTDDDAKIASSFRKYAATFRE